MSKYIIETKNLSCVYSKDTPYEHTALDDVNIKIEEGSFVALIGQTGSGKSTLIQHFNGLIKPSSGKVLIDGEDIWEKPKEIRNVRFKVGMVFQYPEHQLFEETVRKDIAFGPKNMGLSERETEERVLEATEITGLPKECLEMSPFELSGGQKRRVAIAGVMAMHPKVLVLDEPTAGLDPIGREKVLGEIKKYHELTGSTIILVSHSMEDVAKYASHVLVMESSKARLFGTVREVFSDPEKLESMGLDVPQISRVFAALKKKGYDVPDSVLTVDEAAKVILSMVKGGSFDA